MPRMDGLTFLNIIMTQKPLPVIIVSSLSEKSSQTTLKALELGALDVIKKPTLSAMIDEQDIERHNFIELVKTSVKAKIRKLTPSKIPVRENTVVSGEQKTLKSSMIKTTEKVVLIGASTGGTEALREILMELPYDCPAIAIVQHMPETFTRAFAARLNQLCNISVKEAQNGDSLIRGQALIAPGNKHMLVKRSGARYFVELTDDEPVNRHRPSVDVLFESAARFAGANCLAFLLTGMGRDGAKGMLDLKEAGADTFAQNEETSIVFGMPKEAIKLNAVKKIIPLNSIAELIMKES
jgi:two-component system, chemotaxis family, protein-glutamate methylesterase/glutaminase